MKTKLLIPTVLLFAFATTNTFAQIPNSGFENWTNSGTFEYPTGWGMTNPYCTGSFFPCTKSTDIPFALGTYSIRLENNPSLVPSPCSIGLAESSQVPPNFKFIITGHPTSLTGYYKFIPLGGDTMTIAVALYNGTSAVSGSNLQTIISTPNWTSFNITFPVYTTADSAEIVFGTYNFLAGNGAVPHGNSVLYVDNLNFDNLITGVSDIEKQNKISVYPNPFSAQATLQTDNLLKNATLTVYNYFGQTVKEIKNISGQTVTFSRDNLPGGLYFIRITQDSKMISADKFVITD
jgi:hypothetical protein